ncbi:MAG: hypothetical protein P4L53_08890 [Candidatus Obscuribacterales bacterium]|nr:hypothetical protein [Candidatus Obscuribacterales bacterium]
MPDFIASYWPSFREFRMVPLMDKVTYIHAISEEVSTIGLVSATAALKAIVTRYDRWTTKFLQALVEFNVHNVQAKSYSDLVRWLKSQSAEADTLLTEFDMILASLELAKEIPLSEDVNHTDDEESSRNAGALPLLLKEATNRYTHNILITDAIVLGAMLKSVHENIGGFYWMLIEDLSSAVSLKV